MYTLSPGSSLFDITAVAVFIVHPLISSTHIVNDIEKPAAITMQPAVYNAKCEPTSHPTANNSIAPDSPTAKRGARSPADVSTMPTPHATIGTAYMYE